MVCSPSSMPHFVVVSSVGPLQKVGLKESWSFFGGSFKKICIKKSCSAAGAALNGIRSTSIYQVMFTMLNVEQGGR